jgi:PAS domain S-box-containing protein
MKTIPEVMQAAEGHGPSDAIDELPVAYVEMDAHGAVTRANRLTRMAHSCHAGELIGKLAWELMPTEEQDLSCAVFATAMETGVDPGVSRRSIYTSEDTFRVFDLHRNLIRNAGGKPTGMRVVSVDVTESHRAQHEAEQALQWLESVFASMADAVIVTDTLGLIRTVNPAAEELFGWKAAELIGKEIEKAFSLLSFASGDKTQLDCALGLDTRARGVATMLDRENREMRVEIISSPMVDKRNGSAAGVVSVLRRVEEGG